MFNKCLPNALQSSSYWRTSQKQIWVCSVLKLFTTNCLSASSIEPAKHSMNDSTAAHSATAVSLLTTNASSPSDLTDEGSLPSTAGNFDPNGENSVPRIAMPVRKPEPESKLTMMPNSAPSRFARPPTFETPSTVTLPVLIDSARCVI